MRKIISLLVLMLISTIGVYADESWTGTNTAPVAVDDNTSTSEDVGVVINVLSNDTDIDNNTLTVLWVSNVSNWTAVLNSSWNIVFTPFVNFNWTWSLEYTLSDGNLTDIWKVLITVSPVNDYPVAVDDTFTMVKNTTATLNLITNDTDADWNKLTITSLWTVLNWTATINSTNTWIIFTPNTDFVWVISFNYTVSDWVLTDIWVVTINISQTTTTNNIPDAKDDYVSVLRNTSKTFDPRLNDIDKDGDTLTITWITNPSHGTVSFTSTSITYTPSTDYYGNDTYTYTISDSKWWTDTAKVKINVYKDNSDDDDEDENEDDDDDDYGHHNWKHVREIHKEFQAKFRELKNRYKHRMGSQEYKNAKKELQNEYKNKLKEVTWQWKKDNIDGEDEEEDDDKSNKYKYQGDTLKSKYKNEFKRKYWSKISKLSDEKLTIIVWKIDKMISDVNNWNYSEDVKSKTNTMLLALRELVVEYMNNDNNIVDIDSLFE